LPSSPCRPRHWSSVLAIPALGPSHWRHLLPALLVKGELRGQSVAAGCSRVCPPYVVVYGSGLTGGLLLSETMDVSERLGGDVLDFVVGCSIFSTHQPPAGVAGLASLPLQLGLRRLSYCLISRIYDDQEGAMGDVVLEGAVESSQNGLSFTSSGTPPPPPAPPSPSTTTLVFAGSQLTGPSTTFTYMEPRVFEPVAWAVAAATAGRYNRSEALEQLTGLRPCFRLAGAGNRLLQLTFHWKGRAKMKFKGIFDFRSKKLT
ncbi:hypothetical protein Taro_027952, partial [Colocasia esculenta]|nr:hypothetical protein [Colocasia esculenta]